MAIDLAALRAKYEDLTKDKGTGDSKQDKYIKLEDGENVVRILPPADPDQQWYAETSIHRVPQEGQSWDRNVQCRKIHGEACPLCDLYYALWDGINKKTSTDEDADKKMANKIRARPRYYMNILDRADENKVKILSVGVKLYKSIVGAILDEDFGDITDLQTGNDYKVHKADVEGYPNYDQSRPRPGKTAALGSKKEISAAMDTLHDIQDLVKLEDYDDLRVMAESLAVHGRVASMKKDNASWASKKGTSDEEFENKLKG